MSAPERASRQNLVVPPRRGNSSVALGALACGCVGFGMVWALGAGRSRITTPEPATVPAVAESAPAAESQGRQRAADEFESRDFVPIDASAPPSAVADAAVKPASFATNADASSDAGGRFSRFSTAIQNSSSPTAEPPGVTPPERLALPPADEIGPALDSPSPDTAPAAVVAPIADPEPLDSGDAADTAAPSEGAASVPAPEHPDDPVDARTAAPPVADALPPDAAVAPRDAAARDPIVDPTPHAVTTAGPATGAPTNVVAPQSFPPQAFVPPAPPPTMTASVPFASAPALLAEGPPDRGGRQPTAPPPAETSGQARPGPIQLEGVQSPQLTVEKRGPREVQVGKPARYEIVVRNVGSAVARDVTLRDAVPFGAALVTTTPPATPGRAAPGVPSDELVWSLGELSPGGQARVVVELMPQAEGEIGSVASVSFRAEASVRSRATKPALSIQCSEPKPVLIGRDAGLSITIANPGSGVATGVVLEGLLPENVSHRSGSELEFDVGQLKPGESRTIDLVLGTRGPGVHTARLMARADGGIEVQQAVKLEVTAPTLEIAIDMPVRRFLQRPATCAIAMVNAGTAPARAVELAAQLPPGMKFVRANNAGWHDERTHRVLWNLEELPPGETGTVEVVVMPVELGSQKITAAARSADGLADQVAHTCDVEGLAALVFEVADSEDPIEVEGVTEYVVRVGNQGTKAATGVRLTATLLGDLEPVEARGPAGHRVENLTVSFEPLAKLAPAEEAVYRVRAKGRSAGDQRVQVQITSEDHPAPITKEETTRVYADR
jgi:uncharacterized repeat protein (TIGR01451 family)